MNIKRSIIAGIFIIFIILAYSFSVYEYLTLDMLKTYATYLTMITQQYYVLAVLTYLIIFIGVTIACIPGTVVLTIASGFLFGVFIGSIYTIIGATTGGLCLFIAVRYVLRKWVQKKFASQLQLFNAEVERNGWRYLLVLQLLPVTPTPVVNLIAGVSTISLFTYAWTTAIGIIPGTVIYAWAGRQLHALQTTADFMWLLLTITILMIGLLLLAPLFWRLLAREQ